jgi:glucose/mannose transport system substrate-binding protein
MVVAVAGLSSCTRTEPDPSNSASESGDQAELTSADVFTWWTTEAEAKGLDELVAMLWSRHPEVEFVDSSVEGGGGSAKELLQARFADGTVPDTFQVHAGKEAQDYINARQVTDLSQLYAEFGLDGVFPKGVTDYLSKDGKYYTIPLAVHRANVLWASVPVLEQAGLELADVNFDSMDAFIKVLDQLKENAPDIVPLAVGNTWCQVHLLETVLIAGLGPDKYAGLFNGGTDWNGVEVNAALNTFATLMTYTNPDRDALDWEPATQLLLDGKAAFTVMGDWVPALLDSQNLIAGTDYLWAAAPGTQGVYDFLADSFVMALGAPHPDGARAWLEVVASKEGQTAFARASGSIPARTDIDPTQLSAYQQAAAESFQGDKVVGSLQHGAAATITQVAAVNAAIAKFTVSPMADSDLQALQAALAAAFA